MNSMAICAERLSKVYDIGAQQERHNTLRDHLSSSLRSLTRWNHRPAANSQFWALRDVSFDVPRGQIMGFIGRNGAGKSTLLKLLSRITDPTDGRARIYGRVGSLLEVGTGFHSELTGRENIYLSGAILGMSKGEIDRKLDQIIDFSEIEKFVDTPVKRYSSGMYVRLAFAVAAHLETEILLVDEVLAVGDAAFQKKCLGQMGEVADKEGRTVLFVSHNMAMIGNLCERVIWLKDGHVARDGAPNEVISSYLADLSQMSSTPLVHRTDRQGRGDVRAVAIELRNAAGNAVGHPISGQQVAFRLHYRTEPGKVVRNCRLCVTVHKAGALYFLLSTDLVDKTQIDLEGEGAIDLIVPELPLTAGTYDLTTYIQSGPDVQDWVDQAAEMSVIDGDFYGTGRNYPPDWRGATVLVHHSWRHHKSMAVPQVTESLL
jgi:lipopolysaccharide transport system ATP-binding protein